MTPFLQMHRCLNRIILIGLFCLVGATLSLDKVLAHDSTPHPAHLLDFHTAEESHHHPQTPFAHTHSLDHNLLDHTHDKGMQPPPVSMCVSPSIPLRYGWHTLVLNPHSPFGLERPPQGSLDL